jgi:hypothetical protein
MERCQSERPKRAKNLVIRLEIQLSATGRFTELTLNLANVFSMTFELLGLCGWMLKIG